MQRAGRHDLAPPLDAQRIGLEARTGPDDHLSLKLWLRLLACSTDIETEIRRRLRAGHGMTLARFDYLAQLERQPEGLRMSALSRCLMVTGGNVTGITDQLEAEGLVERVPVEGDRRAFHVRLTPAGRQQFQAMAQAHEQWIVDAFAGLTSAEIRTLHQLLGRVKQHFLETT